MTRHTRTAVALAAAVVTTLAALAGAAQAGSGRLPAFTRVPLPQGHGRTEPSMVVDHAGRVYVSAIAGFPGNVGGNPVTGGQQPGTPVWRSLDGGRTWTVHPTANAGPFATNLGGGDSAVVLDKRDYVYATDLWLGDDSISYSTDHAESFTGFPFSHRPADDRNWLAYSPTDDAIYQIYDGLDGLWVSRADLNGPLGTAQALTFPNNYQVAPETATATPPIDGVYARANIDPPGGIAVDPRNGTVYATWPDQDGVAVAKSMNKGANWTIAHILQTSVSGNVGDCLWNFTPTAVDAQGHIFVAYSRINGGTPTNPKGISTWLAESTDGVRWHQVRMPTQATSVFPALAVIGPDRVAVGWVETTMKGNPNDSSFGHEAWRLRYAEVAGLSRGDAHLATATVDPQVHTGSLFVGPQGGDRGMGDFFSMAADHTGRVYLAYTRGRASSAVATVAALPAHPAP
jgi:hypothetical protein